MLPGTATDFNSLFFYKNAMQVAAIELITAIKMSEKTDADLRC